MAEDVAERRALVTGAGAGIGRATALELARKGFAVLATDRDEAALSDLAGRGVETAVLDVTDAASIAEVCKGTGRVDVLVNAAGIVQSGSILDVDEAEVDLGFAVNFRSVLRMTRAVLPDMIAAGRGSIISIASVGSSLKAVPDRFIYSATKAAVIGLTKSVAADMAGKGITCNAVCPGPIDSPSMRQRINSSPDPDAMRDMLNARVPMARMGTPEEVAEMVCYLAEARFVTGQTFVIDGGMTA